MSAARSRVGRGKAITRIDGNKVYWVYNDRSDRRQHVTEYDAFIDKHFIIADRRALRRRCVRRHKKSRPSKP